MEKFLFRFGFCTPAEWAMNEELGRDFESSEALFIVAGSSEAALAWGREVAEKFCEHIFSDAGWPHARPSWKEQGFVHWIDENPREDFEPAALKRIPEVKDREMPDFSGWPQVSFR